MKKWIFLIVVILASLLTLGVVNAAPPEDTTVTTVEGTWPPGYCKNPAEHPDFVMQDVEPCDVVDVTETPVAQELPATGPKMQAMGIFLLGIAFVCFGWLLVKWAYDRGEDDPPRPTTGKASKNG